MDQTTAEPAELTLAVPRAGLTELFRVWTGTGSLLDALAACRSDDEVEWRASDVRQRSRRILLELLTDDLLALPRTSGEWLEYLPVASVSQSAIRSSPAGGTRWVDTVRRCGWPPAAYVSRRRSRSPDTMPLSVLTWVSHRLADVMADVVALSTEFQPRLGASVAALQQATSQIIGGDVGGPPGRSELFALVRSGFPWRTVANIARLISRAERDPEFLAFSLLEPDSDLESRLFHVSVLGYVLAALRRNSCRITWKRPLGASGDGPHVEAESPEGHQWDLWFDSGRSRAYYAAPRSAYSSAVASIAGTGQAMRPDLFLIDFPNRALVIECKWSPEPSYVGRDGYHQASSYALDALNGLADEVWSFIVGPKEIIPEANIATEHLDSMGAVLGSVSVASLHSVITGFLAEDTGIVKQTAALN